ncbi:MAG: 2,5-dihydroxypyridine 5,6-dioxygenase [Halioglobus sp.]
MSLDNIDFNKACRILLHDILLLEKGDRLLIYIDRSPTEVVAGAVQIFANSVGIETEVLQLKGYNNLSDMTQALCDRIATGNFNAIIESSDQYFYLTPVWGQAIKRGCRLFCTGALNTDAFIRCIGKVNREQLADFGGVLYQLILSARRVKLESSAGTHLTFRMNTGSLPGRIMTKLKMTTMSTVWPPTGDLSSKSDATFLGGQLSFQGITDTIEGTAVIDGFMWPPGDVGLLTEPIILHIEHGRVVRIDGDSVKSGILNQWLQGKEKTIEHFCIGFNPGARISDNLVESERAYGHLNIGLGKYPFHTDGVIRNPLLTINGNVLMQNNTFVHKKLFALGKKLRSIID